MSVKEWYLHIQSKLITRLFAKKLEQYLSAKIYIQVISPIVTRINKYNSTTCIYLKFFAFKKNPILLKTSVFCMSLLISSTCTVVLLYVIAK